MLDLPEDATPEEITLRWRQMRHWLHPDHGGDANEFHLVQQAYKQALAATTAVTPCKVCNGAGKLTYSHGFNSIDMPCSFCGGVDIV